MDHISILNWLLSRRISLLRQVIINEVLCHDRFSIIYFSKIRVKYQVVSYINNFHTYIFTEMKEFLSNQLKKDSLLIYVFVVLAQIGENKLFPFVNIHVFFSSGLLDCCCRNKLSLDTFF